MKEKEKELLKIKRVFSPKYVLTEKMIEPYLFFALFQRFILFFEHFFNEKNIIWNCYNINFSFINIH